MSVVLTKSLAAPTGAFLLAALLVNPAARAQDPALPDRAPLELRVDQAISQAKAFLWGRHLGNHWEESGGGAAPRDLGGRTALCLYALLSAGENYQDPRIAATVDWLCKQEIKGVYARSLRTLALAALPRREGSDTLEWQTLQNDVRWLIAAVRPDGAYDVEPSSSPDDSWDNATSGFAVWAVWSASEAGVPVPPEYWRKVEAHWLNTQTGQGGWSYTTARAQPYGSMSASGLASLLLCQDAIHIEDFIRIQGDTSNPPIERGLQWLAENFSPRLNPGKGTEYYYSYLYAVERVGLSGGYKNLGGHDWYAEGAAELTRTQFLNGSWGRVSDTSFALLFLSRGRAPVLVTKLRYDGAWNARPRDIANLTRWISRTFERQVSWQVLDASAPPEQWHDAAVLYISGVSVPKFTPEQIGKLRSFALRGGLIISESAGNSPAFNMAMRKVYAKMFPEWPLERIDPSHPIFSSYVTVKNPPALLGVSNGVRLLVIHSPSDLSKAWQARQYAGQRESFEQAANIYFHATDFASLKQRGQHAWPAESEPPASRLSRVIRVARLEHAGNSNPEPMACERFRRLMELQCGVTVEFSGPMAISLLPPEEYPLAVMTGCDSFKLSESDKKALREFLRAGGLLLADAAGGNAAFDRSAREQLLTLLDEHAPLRLDAQSPLYRRPGMAIEKVSFRRAARLRYGEDRDPRLIAVNLGERPAILYSRDDITAGLVGYEGFNLIGYAPQSAFELMRNVVLYAADRRGIAPPNNIRVEWMGN